MGKSQKSRKVQKRFSRKSKYGGSKMYLMEGGADPLTAGTDDKPKKPEIKEAIISKVDNLTGEKNSDEIVKELFDDNQIPKLKEIIKKLIDNDTQMTKDNDNKYTFEQDDKNKNKERIKKILNDFDYIDDLLNSITENEFKNLGDFIEIDNFSFNISGTDTLSKKKNALIQKVKNISADNRKVEQKLEKRKVRLEKAERTQLDPRKKVYIKANNGGNFDLKINEKQELVSIEELLSDQKGSTDVNPNPKKQGVSESEKFIILEDDKIIEYIEKIDTEKCKYCVFDSPLETDFDIIKFTLVTEKNELTYGKGVENSGGDGDSNPSTTDSNVVRMPIDFSYKIALDDNLQPKPDNDKFTETQTNITLAQYFNEKNFDTENKLFIYFKIKKNEEKTTSNVGQQDDPTKQQSIYNITRVEYNGAKFSGIDEIKDIDKFKIVACYGNTVGTFEDIYYSLGEGEDKNKAIKLNKTITVKGDFEGEKTNLFSYMYTMFIPVHSGIKTGMFMAGSTGDIKTKFQLSFKGSEPGIGKGKESGSGDNVKLSDPEGEPRKTSIGTVKHIVNQLNQNDKGVWGYTRIICEEIGSTNTEKGKKQITNEPGFLVTQEINKGVRYEKMHFQASAILVEICNSIVHRHDNTSGNYYNIPFFDNVAKANSKSKEAVNDKDSVNSKFASFSFINKHLNSVRLGDYMSQKNEMSISSFRRVEYVTNLNQPDTGASKYEFDDENKIYIVPGIK